MTLTLKRLLLSTATLSLCGFVATASALAAPPPGKSPASSGLAGALLAARHANATADTVTATEYYARALEIDPNNNSLLWRSYSAAATAGKMDAAIAAAKRYYDTEDRPFPLAGLLLATGHMQKKEYDQAWSYIDRIQKDSYLAFAMPMIRAWAQAARNTPDAALAELAPLQSAQGLGDLYHMMSGMLNEHFGRNEDALIHYDALAANIERQPLAVIRLIAGGYHRLGKSANVKTMLDKFNGGRSASVGLTDMAMGLTDASRFPKKLTVNDGMAETYFAISQVLSQNGGNNNFSEVSIAFGQMAIYLSPDLNIARWVLGTTLALRGRFDESNAVMSAIKKNDPSYLGAQFQIVDNLTALNQELDALSKLQAMARDYPTMPEIQMAIANIYRKEEKFAEAIAAYDKAEQLYTAAKIDNWTLHYGRGVALERTKQWPKAEADFMRALKLNPDQPDVLNYLGYSWIDRGENFAEARRLIELAYSKAPDNGFIVDSLGWAIYLAGDYKGAVTYLEKAVELEPADPTLNEHLGDVYWKVGRKKEARFQWQRALTLKPEAKQKTSLQAKIEQGLAQK
jgi:Flp pilus assembly protein TadD